MPIKKSTGNMYDWATHIHSHLGGRCPHECTYCYVQRNRFGVPAKYKGPPRLIDEELKVKYGAGKIIFIEHMNDLFANVFSPDGMIKIESDWIEKILQHCREYPGNRYIFQTKNPSRAMEFFNKRMFPDNCIIGTTIETNRDVKESKAPSAMDRIIGIKDIASRGIETFITIEPIMQFDMDEMVNLIKEAAPKFINIGADSKHSGLPEPSKESVIELIKRLQDAGIEMKKKINLSRITGGAFI